MKRSTVALLFVAGFFTGIPLAAVYVSTMTSEDRYFHGFVMLAACCVSFPAIVIFLRSTLKLLDMAIKNEERMKDLGSVAADAKDVLTGVREIIEDFKKEDPKRVIGFLDKLTKDGTLERIAGAIEAVGKKFHEVTTKLERKAVDKLIDEL